jgi:hypothetical protein
MFRGLVTGKVSFTSVEEMYDLSIVKKLKGKPKAEENEKNDEMKKSKDQYEPSDRPVGRPKVKPSKTTFKPDEVDKEPQVSMPAMPMPLVQ